MKTGLQGSRDSLGKIPTKNQIRKIAVGICQQILTAVGRPGRSIANSRISDRWESGRPKSQTESDHSLSVDRTGQPKQTESSALLPVDRAGRPTCTNMHARSGWRAGRLTRSTARVFCFLESPGRESSALCSRPRSTGPVDRWLNGQKSDRWPVHRAGRPTTVQAAILPQRLVFLAYKREAPMDCFKQDF